MSWVFFPENRDKTDEVSAKIASSLEFYSRPLLALVKSSTLLSNEERCVYMKVGSFLYRSTWSELMVASGVS